MDIRANYPHAATAPPSYHMDPRVFPEMRCCRCGATVMRWELFSLNEKGQAMHNECELGDRDAETRIAYRQWVAEQAALRWRLNVARGVAWGLVVLTVGGFLLCWGACR